MSHVVTCGVGYEVEAGFARFLGWLCSKWRALDGAVNVMCSRLRRLERTD